ncbi:hypothetical protein [Clostridium grantii]|uniref:Uncharacterized protein n=1 Tax=Clostridium grantii DSM 8605 TaxID=1121316 RepID=A0A1M5VMT6_9CLOT|nr:hypothetical protein [Clostridium grantii]SHH76243.1 hypothetical protein SAMN02745207_02347 [Clostridium grantii DSM 8605]
MEIIDLKDQCKNTLEPICKIGDRLILREKVDVYYPFTDSGIVNYFNYSISNDKMYKINVGKEKILLDIYHQESVEGKNEFYYVTIQKQLFVNDFTLYKVDLETSKASFVHKFQMEKRYEDFLLEKLDDDHFIMFYKEMKELTEEQFKNFNYAKEIYGYHRAVIYNVKTDEHWEVMDKDFLRGVRLVFFKTSIKNTDCVVYEENYLEPYEKEEIYKKVKIGRKSKKARFFYWDRIRFLSIKDFINQVQMGNENLPFQNVEEQGIDGYELFSGADEENIYYEINKYNEANKNAIVMLNRNTLSKKVIPLNEEITFENSRVDRNSIEYSWKLDDKNKAIFLRKIISKDQVEVKEIVNGNVNYVYERKLGYPVECIDDRYLIIYSREQKKNTTIADIHTGTIKTLNRQHAVYDNYLILF